MILREAGVYRRPRKTLGVVRKGDELSLLGIISHFRNYPRQDGTLLSVIGNEERPLQAGRCYVLDGVNDGVLFTTAIVLDADFEISFKTTTGSDVTMRHFLAHNAGSGKARIALNSTSLISIYKDDDSSSSFTGYTFLANTDYNIAIARVGSSITLTVDGVLESTITLSGDITIDSFGLARGQATSWGTYDGSIWDVSITKAGTLQAHYKCDEQEGLTAYDSSGNGNHGTITNATLSSFHGTQGDYSFQNQVGYSGPIDQVTNGTFDTDLTGWTTQTGYTQAGGKAVCDGSTNVPKLAQDDVCIIGVEYTLTVTVSGYTSGACYVVIGGAQPAGNNLTSNGTYTLTTTASSLTNLQLVTPSGTYDGSFDNITLKPTSSFIPRNESTPSQDVLGNTLQHRGQAKLIAKARENACGTFDGSNDEVLVPTAITLDADFDISCYISVGSASDQKAFLGDSTGPSYIRTNNSSTAFNIRNDNSTSVTIGNNDGALNLDQIYLFRITRDASNLIRIYIDGVAQDDTETSSGDIILDLIGIRNGSNNPFDGKIFDVSIAKAGTLQGHWPLSEGNGTVIHDTSGNANHGTATNITQSSFWGSTQDEYATNFVDGFTPYFTEDDTLIVAGQTLTDISFTIDLMGETGRAVMLGNSGSDWLIIFLEGSTSPATNSNYGSVTLTVDGVTFSGNRGELYNLLAVTGSHVITVSLSASFDLYYGGHSSSGWEINGQVISNVKVNGVSYDGPTRVPAKSSTLDAYGNALTNPASPTHNDFEGVIDYREVGVLDATPPALDHIYTGAAEFDGVSGSYASVPDAANLNGITNFVMEARDVTLDDWATGNETFFAKYSSGGNAFAFRKVGTSVSIYAFYVGAGTDLYFPHGLTGAATASIRVTRAGTSVTAELDTGSGYVAIGSAQTVPSGAISTTTSPLEIGARSGGTSQLLTGKIGQVRMWSDATQTTKVLDIDFRKFNHKLRADYATSGQLVTLNGGVTFPKVTVPDALAYDDTYPRDYCEFDGVSGSNVSFAAPSITTGGEWTLTAKLAANVWALGSDEQSIYSINDGNNAFIWRISHTGSLQLYIGGSYKTGTAAIQSFVPDGADLWIRTKSLAGFGYSIDFSLDGVTWAQQVTTGAGHTDIAWPTCNIGDRGAGTDTLTGKVYQVKLETPTATIFDVDFSTANARNGIAETGQALTYNGGAAIPLSTLANPMFQRDDSWTRLFEVGLNDSDAAKQI